MVDLYAIVRRLTGHELISPKDARLLTEAVDGLIGEIGSKDARIAELEAENERLKQEIAATQEKLIRANDELIQRNPKALSRTGAVKPLEWTKVTAARSDEDPNREHTGDYEAETPFGTYYIEQYFGSDSYVYEVTFNGYDKIGDHDDPSDAKATAQADYERRILSALTTEPAAPEGRQEPVAWGEDIDGKIVSVRLDKSRHCTVPLYPAPQPSGPVGVKPLKWDEHPAGGQQAIAAGLGLYRVHANGDDWYLVPDHMGKGGRAAAQADYERRILSALTAGKPEQAVPSGWQTIATAPKDGTPMEPSPTTAGPNSTPPTGCRCRPIPALTAGGEHE